MILNHCGPGNQTELHVLHSKRYATRTYSGKAWIQTLGFYIGSQVQYLILAELAKKYSCVPSERIFSKSGYIVNGYLSRLLPRNVNMFVLLAKTCLNVSCLFLLF